MDSDEEEISDTDILNWYTERVGEIWDSATNSAFNDISTNLTDMFRQVMNNIKQRNQPSEHMNGHSSMENGDASQELQGQVTNVEMSSEQLMELLENDEDWLDDTSESTEDRMVLSVRLQQEPHQEQDQKNVTGVSQEINSFLADSFCCICKIAKLIILTALKCIIYTLLIFIFIYIISLLHNPTQKWFLCHIQNYIYPTMRTIRLMTVSWVKQYPSLSDWHEETCLIPNPLFWHRPLDCWSCDKLISVEEFWELDYLCTTDYFHTGRPFIMKNSSAMVTLHDIEQLYQTSTKQFIQGIGSFSSRDHHNISDFFLHINELSNESQISWMVNRVGTVRLFRQLFQRPPFIPLDTEVALHKYVFISGPFSRTFKFPTTEFANVWIVQGAGSRSIRLIPSPSCAGKCSGIDVILFPGDILYYNWQFWHPESSSVGENGSLSITYVGSFY